MIWKNPTRLIFRSMLVMLAVAALVAVAAFLPGKVEGNYNNFLSKCMCEGTDILNMRAGRMTHYHADHPPPDLFARYVTRPDGVVEFHRPSWKEAGKEELLMTAYPHLLVTKFVHVASGDVYWRCKVPSFGEIGNMIRDQEISEHVPARKGFQKRKILDPNFKLIRHESKRAKQPWKTVAGDEVEVLVYQAIHVTPDFSIGEMPRGHGLAYLKTRTYSGDNRPVTVRRQYRRREKLLEAEVSRAAFDSAYQESLLHDSYRDSFHREHVDLLLIVADRNYIVEYESGELNGEGPEGDRFRIAAADAHMATGDSPFGTSHDRKILGLLRKAAPADP